MLHPVIACTIAGQNFLNIQLSTRGTLNHFSPIKHALTLPIAQQAYISPFLTAKPGHRLMAFACFLVLIFAAHYVPDINQLSLGVSSHV